jgi:hypothetical protein
MGGRLLRLRRRARSAGGDQGALDPGRRRDLGARPDPPRGPGARPPLPPQHRPDLRGRRGQRPSLPGDGDDRGHEPPPVAGGGPRLAGGRRPLPRGRPRPGGRPRGGAGSPRLQARQRDRRPRRPGAGRRLRPRAGGAGGGADAVDDRDERLGRHADGRGGRCWGRRPTWRRSSTCGSRPITGPTSSRFSVALYEALYGERPFAGRGEALSRAILAGEVREAPAGSRVPAWLRRVLVRGLASDPAERWPAMEPLLAALADDPMHRRRRGIGLGALAVGAAVAGALLRPVALDAPPCEGDRRRLRRRLGRGPRGRPRRGAARIGGPPTRAGTWARARALLDAHARAIPAAAVEACEDAHVHGRHSGGARRSPARLPPRPRRRARGPRRVAGGRRRGGGRERDRGGRRPHPDRRLRPGGADGRSHRAAPGRGDRRRGRGGSGPSSRGSRR